MITTFSASSISSRYPFFHFWLLLRMRLHAFFSPWNRFSESIWNCFAFCSSSFVDRMSFENRLTKRKHARQIKCVIARESLQLERRTCNAATFQYRNDVTKCFSWIILLFLFVAHNQSVLLSGVFHSFFSSYQRNEWCDAWVTNVQSTKRTRSTHTY